MKTELLTESIDGNMTNYDIKFQRQTTHPIWAAVDEALEGNNMQTPTSAVTMNIGN